MFLPAKQNFMIYNVILDMSSSQDQYQQKLISPDNLKNEEGPET